MKKLYRLFLILSVVILSISCASTAQAPSASSGYTGFADLDYLKVTLDDEALKSVDTYLQALEDNSNLLPEFDQGRRSDGEYTATYSAYKKLHDVREVVLIGELAEAFPSAPELEDLLLRRFELNTAVWQLDILPEVEAYAKKYAAKTEKVKQAWYWYADGLIHRNYKKPDQIKSALELFKNRYDGSDKLLDLYQKAIRYLDGTKAQDEVTEEMEKEFPNAEEVLRAKENTKREAEKKALIGKVFELKFEDRLSGRTVDTKELRGKVLVVDFWATWCGPCVAEVPKMINLYETYRHRGVEFIGISLDKEVSTLVDFCREKGITWPQYCEPGKAWDTEFSRKWKISAVPSIYIVDKQGRVHAVDGRRKIEQYLDDLL